ncbi:MAG: MFS transporter [Nitrososphaerales archaeon]
MQRKAPKPGLQIYFAVSFGANIALTVFYVFLPIRASQLGASPLEIGLVGGSSYILYSFMPFVMGRISDKRRLDKYYIALSLVIISIASLVYAFAKDPIEIILMRLPEGVGWAMLWPAIQSSLSRNISRDPSSSLSRYNFSWSLSAAIGPLIAAILISYYSMQFMFLIIGAITFVVLLVYVIPIFIWNGPKKDVETNLARQNSDEGVKLIQSLPVHETQTSNNTNSRKIELTLAIFSIVIVAGASRVLFTFFGPYATSTNVSILVIGSVSVVYGVARLFMYALTTQSRIRQILLRNDIKRVNLLMGLGVVCVANLLILVHDPTNALYVASFFLAGVGYSIVYTISQLTIIVRGGLDNLGMKAGIFESSLGIGSATMPIVAGLVSRSSLTTAFIVPSVLFLFMLVSLGISFSYSRRAVNTREVL